MCARVLSLEGVLSFSNYLLSAVRAYKGRTSGESTRRPAAQLARQAPGGTYLAGNQVVVNIDELNLRRRHTSLLHRRHDLLLGETLELFS